MLLDSISGAMDSIAGVAYFESSFVTSVRIPVARVVVVLVVRSYVFHVVGLVFGKARLYTVLWSQLAH